MTTIDGKSPNLAHETQATIRDLLMEPAICERLKQICPDAFCDGDLQMDLLFEAMGKYHTTENIKELVVDENERYEFRWSGKQKAKYESQKSSTGTLRPCPEESKNWDTTQNLYIEGDNLEVLKILKRAYAGKIKMIYIDPPYNTGKDFVYKDDYTDNLKNYLQQTGQLTADGKAKSSNTASDGRFHTNWLNMMYPRLRLARELLSDDGVIFISIDDHEVENLKKICDEVFLDSNFVAQVVWKNKCGSGASTSGFIGVHEYILIYSKMSVNNITRTLTDEERKIYNKTRDSKFDTRGGYVTQPLAVTTFGDRPNLRYPIYYNGHEIWPKKQWVWEKKRMLSAIENDEVVFNLQKDGTYNLRSKKYLIDGNGMERRGKPTTLYTEVYTQNGTDDIRNLFNMVVFDYTKPVDYIKYFLDLEVNDIHSKNDIILDFFSGSATTAHAIIQLNAKDGGNRKFIMVQLPEEPDGKGEAAKAGYKNICEIGKERIRRAGETIIEDAKKAGKDVSGLDVGFKVFKLSESNMNKWHLELADLKDKSDMEKAAIDAIMAGKNTIRRAEIAAENERRKAEGLAPFDIDLCVIYEWLLKYGVMPDCHIDTVQIGGHKVYSVSGGAFMVCLEHGLNRDWALSLIAYRDKCFPNLDDATKSDAWHVMVADECFDDTRDMQNVYKTLHDAGLKDEHWIVV